MSDIRFQRSKHVAELLDQAPIFALPHDGADPSLVDAFDK